MDIHITHKTIGIYMCKKCFHKIEFDVDLIDKAQPRCPDCNKNDWELLRAGFLKEYGAGSQDNVSEKLIENITEKFIKNNPRMIYDIVKRYEKNHNIG